VKPVLLEKRVLDRHEVEQMLARPVFQRFPGPDGKHAVTGFKRTRNGAPSGYIRLPVEEQTWVFMGDRPRDARGRPGVPHQVTMYLTTLVDVSRYTGPELRQIEKRRGVSATKGSPAWIRRQIERDVLRGTFRTAA